MLTNKAPWVVLLVLWIIGSTWWQVCKIRQLCFDLGAPAPSVSAAAPTDAPTGYTTLPGADGFAIADGNFFRLEFPRTFSFAKSDANTNMNALGEPIDPLIAYLKINPGRTLTITGYYAPTETNATALGNLGLARAEGVKQYLVQQGVSANAITTQGEKRNLPFTAQGDSLKGGLDFAFSGPEPAADKAPESTPAVTPAPETSLAAAPASDTPVTLPTLTEPVTENELARGQKFTSVTKPMDLYFQLGEASYIKTDETKKFFEEAIRVLAADKGKKLLLTGHTDSSGPDEVNRQLSLDRANDVKARLRKAGIRADQISVKAMGEAEPKADNSTLSGRKANRRVTVVVLN